MRRSLAILLTACCLLGSLPAASAENTERKNSPVQKASSEKKTERIQLGVEMRWRFEFRDNADQQPSHDFDGFLGQRIRAYLRLRLHRHLSAFLQGQEVSLFGAASDKVIHELPTNLHQAYLDWRPRGSERWEFRGGRQELSYGDERLIGAFGWDTVGRSFDAVRVRHRTGAWSNDFFAGRVVDVRRAGARHRLGDQDFYGVYLTRAPRGSAGHTEIYGLFLRDGLRTAGEFPGRAAKTTRILTLGLRRNHQPKTGWRYLVEHAWQFGQRGPDPHRAAMLVSSLGYAWGGPFQPRLSFEYDFATGDDDFRDGNSREFHNLFPTNHPHYGYADLLGLRNMHALRLTVAARPHAKLVVEADYHRFVLAARRGPWRNAVGRVLGFDPTGKGGRDLGQEMDLTLRIPLKKHLSFLTGYSVFIPGAFAARTRGPELQQFGYVQTSLSF